MGQSIDGKGNVLIVQEFRRLRRVLTSGAAMRLA